MSGRLEEKTLAGVVRAAMEARLEGLYTALPGRVVRYDATKQVADVLPTLKRPIRTADGGTVLEELPILPAVPLVFLAAGGFRLTLPVLEGDPVLVLFTMRAHAEWRRTGEVADPGDTRLHHLGGAVAIPGLLTEEASGAHPDHLVLGKKGGAEIHVTAGEVRLGSEAPADAVALASKVEKALDDLKTAIQGWTPIANDGGAALKTALGTLFSSWPGSLGSSKVKAD